jgi:hypothetical protein
MVAVIERGTASAALRKQGSRGYLAWNAADARCRTVRDS